MQNIQLLMLVTAIAALIAGLNVAHVAHAQDTCSVGTNANNNPTSNKQSPTGTGIVSGNPHCFDPEQQPTGTTGTGGATGTGACAAGTTTCNHPQSTNGAGTVTGNPHEEPASGCQGVASCSTNPQGSIVGDPHYPTR
jgi:hypothetical protein